MKCGLIGGKLGHSFSKIIHEQLTDAYSYELMPLKKEELDDFMKKRDFNGINVTIPYKMDVIPYLDYLDKKAATIGAVNTIVNNGGKLSGYNTDFFGFLYLLKQNNIIVSDKKVLMLGKGGASKAVIAVLKHLNAGEIITVYYKNSFHTVTYEECICNHNDSHIIINTTPVGMYPNHGEASLDISNFNTLEAVIDVIYNPIATDIIVQAKKRGIKAVGGLEMLVGQAYESTSIFLNKAIAMDNIDKIYRRLLGEQLNIVLIGMPTCGKTTIGTYLSQEMNRNFVDTDDEIIKKIGMPIADYFAQFGEAAFREIETAVIKEISGKTNSILSTGGGCVLNERNIDYLSQNGIIIFIERPVDELLVGEGRPLSKSKDAVLEMYTKRLPLYLKYSIAAIPNNSSVLNVAHAIQEAYFNIIQNY